QVNNAITSMDEVTQQNAALVEQAAAAAESLVDQAMGLMDTVNAFKLSQGSTHGGKKSAGHNSSKPAVLARFNSALKPPLSKTSQAPLAKLNGVSQDGDWEEF
ncbi:MAG TPA: methyl-accepting chemotaxis protein, partial [Methylotenera sp.]